MNAPRELKLHGTAKSPIVTDDPNDCRATGPLGNCRHGYPFHDCAMIVARLREALAAAERQRDECATYDALCRFFSLVTQDMSQSGEVDTCNMWESAETAGLARQVPYNKNRHSDIDDLGDDDLVWELTVAGNRAVGRANDLKRQAAPASLRARLDAAEADRALTARPEGAG